MLVFCSRTHGIDTEGSSIQIGLDLSISDRLLLSVSPTLEGVQSNTLNKQMFTDGKLNIKGLVQWVKQVAQCPAHQPLYLSAPL